MPIKDKMPSSKLHLMLLGAISFQSKAHKLPQSTTQVLINIQAFAFKSSPIYSSFPSICETWNPLCFAKTAVCRGLTCSYQTNITEGPPGGRLGRSSVVLHVALCTLSVSSAVSRGTRRSGRPLHRVNIELVLVVSANSSLFTWLHCRRLPDLLSPALILISNI